MGFDGTSVQQVGILRPRAMSSLALFEVLSKFSVIKTMRYRL